MKTVTPSQFPEYFPPPQWVRSYYRCPVCGNEWQDTWDSACDDQCPECNTDTAPYRFEDAEWVEGEDNRWPGPAGIPLSMRDWPISPDFKASKCRDWLRPQPVLFDI